MSKLPLFAVVAGVLGLTLTASGDEPAPKEREPKTYTVSCKLIRKLRVNDGEKSVLETINNKIPDLTTLEATRAEYHTGGKISQTPYGFQLQVEVKPATGDKVHLDVTVEDSSTDGGFNPVVRTHRQHVVRRVQLGQTIAIELEKNENGEGTLVELIVRESN